MTRYTFFKQRFLFAKLKPLPAVFGKLGITLSDCGISVKAIMGNGERNEGNNENEGNHDGLDENARNEGKNVGNHGENDGNAEN